MRTQNGSVTIVVLCLTWAITCLFGILIARATYRAMSLRDPQQYYHLVLLNDSLERIRAAVLGEAITWGSI